MDQPDEGFSAWQSPLVQRALSQVKKFLSVLKIVLTLFWIYSITQWIGNSCFQQVVSLMTTPLYKPLLDGCAGYLSSFSLAHVRLIYKSVSLFLSYLVNLPLIIIKCRKGLRVSSSTYVLAHLIHGYQWLLQRSVNLFISTLFYFIFVLTGN